MRAHLEGCSACAEDRDSLRALLLSEAGSHSRSGRPAAGLETSAARAPIHRWRVRPAPSRDAEEDMNAISAVAESNGHAPAVLPTVRGRGRPTGARLTARPSQRAARDLLVALGADLETEGLRETPRRMAAAYLELLTPEPFSLTTFPNDEGYDELVVVRDIPFESLCMHHVLPFHGVAHVALPAGRADRRPLEARARCRAVRPRSPAARAAHDPDRRLPAGRSCSRRGSAS